MRGSVEASEVGVKAVDDQTLEVQLKSPTPYFLNLTTMDMFFPVNEAFCEEQGTNFALSPDTMLYCGPYVITDYDPAVGVTFAKNDNYWDKDNVAIRRCTGSCNQRCCSCIKRISGWRAFPG